MADEEEIIEDPEFAEDLADTDVDPDELDEDELDEETFELDGEDDAEVELEEEVVDEEETAAAATTAPRRAGTTTTTTPEEEDEDEDLVDPDDVEADLDTILKDRLVTAEEEADDEEEEVEVDDRGDPVDRIQPKRPGEFVCQSCFLVKHPSQLADAKRQLCTDCV